LPVYSITQPRARGRGDAQSAPDSKGNNEKMMPQAKALNDDRDLPIGVTL